MRRFLLMMTLLGTACGGGRPDAAESTQDDAAEDVQYTAEDMVPRAVLDRAELTLAVDEKRFRAAAPIQTEFEVSDPVIYFVGKLKRVPTDATIEVRWFMDRDPKPMLVSNVQGSDTFSFVASFSPRDARFMPGTYAARVIVDDRDVGGLDFTIGHPDASSSALVSKVAFSTAVTGNMKPKKPSSKFKSGTKKLYVTFDVKGAEPESSADILWFRGEDEFHRAEVGLDGNRRYGAHVESPGGLPDGEYKVEILVAGAPAAEETVVVGKKTGGPAVDEIEFGLVLKDNNMPKRAMRVFRRDTSVIQCGFRFVDLPPDTTIEVQWYFVDADGDSLLYRNVSSLESGGSGTMGAAWEPGYDLDRGEYKVVIVVNDTPLGEETFTVE